MHIKIDITKQAFLFFIAVQIFLYIVCQFADNKYTVETMLLFTFIFICVHAVGYKPDKELEQLEYICTLYYTYMYLFDCYVKKKDHKCNIAYFAINKNFKEQIIREVFEENHIKNYDVDNVILELDKINKQIIKMNSGERYSKYIAYIFEDKKRHM